MEDDYQQQLTAEREARIEVLDLRFREQHQISVLVNIISSTCVDTVVRSSCNHCRTQVERKLKDVEHQLQQEKTRSNIKEENFRRAKQT
jgi:hypothetical protein